jgi:PAS domain S-box-containing protein
MTPSGRLPTLTVTRFPQKKLPFMLVKEHGVPVFDVQHAITLADGKRVLLNINAAPLFNEAGEFDGMVASVEDVTEKVLQERAFA